MFNRVLNTAMNCYHSSSVFMPFYLFTVKPYLVTKNVSFSTNIYIRQVYSSAKFFFNYCAGMQSNSADAVQSLSTLRLKEIICLSFIYKILVMAFRSSVNDVTSGNAIVSKFKNEVVFWGAYCQTNCKQETSPI